MTEKTKKDHPLNNSSYNALKPVVQVWLPALATLYFAVAKIWGLPSAEEVVGTIAAVATFLGLVLGYSTKQYDKSWDKYDGSIDVEQGEDKKLISLNLDGDPDQIDEMKEVRFWVNK